VNEQTVTRTFIMLDEKGAEISRKVNTQERRKLYTSDGNGGWRWRYDEDDGDSTTTVQNVPL